MASSGPKDMFSSKTTHNDSVKEGISPHKLVVLIFIRDFCELKKAYRDGVMGSGTATQHFRPNIRRCFALLALKLIQSEDIDFNEFLVLLKSHQKDLLITHLDKFEANLIDLFRFGIDNLEELIQGLTTYMTEPSHMSPIVVKSSVIGLFFRRIMVLYQKMSFAQVGATYKSFKDYYSLHYYDIQTIHQKMNEVEAAQNFRKWRDEDCTSEMPLMERTLAGDLIQEMVTPSIPPSRHSTKRTADLFIAKQAHLLESNEPEALPPKELQKGINNIVRFNPEFGEAHFLTYLNCIRAREFPGALHSLYHCFDRNLLISEARLTTSEDKNRASRYAALNLAILYAQFDHKKEALSALKEAIMLAHEVNDNVCLQHALAWLFKLTKGNQEVLMERLISRSNELNLYRLSSLGIQSFANFSAITGAKPALVFDLLMKSDILNWQHSMMDLACNSQSQKAALWCMYGKTIMMSITSQVLLQMNTATLSAGRNVYNSEGTCQAICNVANVLMEKGDYKDAHLVLGHARERFPYEPVSHHWMICEQIVTFTQALHREKWQEAAAAVKRLAPLNKWESLLRKSELFLARREYVTAVDCVQILVDSGLTEDKMICPTIRARALILEAEIYSSSCSKYIVPAVGMEMFLSTLNLTQLHYLDYLTAMVKLHIANLQFQMGLATKGLQLINESMLTVLTNGGLYDRGRALLLLVKCKVASTAGSPPDVRQASLLNATVTLEKVKENFLKVESYGRAKDVLYLQALLFNDMQKFPERNKCSLEYRALEDQYPTQNPYTILTRL